MEFLKTYQLDIMLFLCGICFVLAVLTLFTSTLSARRRYIVARLHLYCLMLLAFERCAYIYRGDVSELGYWMVRISNFVVFASWLLLLHVLSLYLRDLLVNKCNVEKIPVRMWICEILFLLGIIVLIVSQYTGWLYTFSADNMYSRGDYLYVHYIISFAIAALQLSLIIQYRRKISHGIATALVLNTVIPILATLLQLKFYGISIGNMTIVGMAIFLYSCIIIDNNKAIDQAKQNEIEYYKQLNSKERAIFEQTAIALADAIDAKDSYTAGHSSRVAEYSRKIAELAGKTPEECDEIYYIALLHDVGKIGIPESIITKDGKLTDEEYKIIKEHSAIGAQILQDITEYPALAIGAHYHHERYDGKGYPEGLKGNDIPEIARIIAVADAYDAMTSFRSYRKPILQEIVREQFIMCSGTQFDPVFANLMLSLIDEDTAYIMKERSAEGEPKIKDELIVHEHRSNVSKGIHISQNTTYITFRVRPDKDGNTPEPSIVLFDSLDGHYYWEEKPVKELRYHEYCEIDVAGNIDVTDLRDYKIKTLRADDTGLDKDQFKIQAVKYKDHAQVVISERGRAIEVTLAMPDNVSFLYIGFTGKNCIIYDMSMSRSDKMINADFIPRIAPVVSFIDGPDGDIPSVQVDGYRTDFSEGIPVKDGMKVSFHTKSFPSARLIWHCPYAVLYSSDDGKITGANYREYAFMRIEGETWNSTSESKNWQEVDRTGFDGWDTWRQKNAEGYDCTISFELKGNRITAHTENFGISIKNHTEIDDFPDVVYVALTGDQVTLTDIRINV